MRNTTPGSMTLTEKACKLLDDSSPKRLETHLKNSASFIEEPDVAINFATHDPAFVEHKLFGYTPYFQENLTKMNLLSRACCATNTTGFDCFKVILEHLIENKQHYRHDLQAILDNALVFATKAERSEEVTLLLKNGANPTQKIEFKDNITISASEIKQENGTCRNDSWLKFSKFNQQFNAITLLAEAMERYKENSPQSSNLANAKLYEALAYDTQLVVSRLADIVTDAIWQSAHYTLDNSMPKSLIKNYSWLKKAIKTCHFFFQLQNKTKNDSENDFISISNYFYSDVVLVLNAYNFNTPLPEQYKVFTSADELRKFLTSVTKSMIDCTEAAEAYHQLNGNTASHQTALLKQSLLTQQITQAANEEEKTEEVTPLDAP